jgi:hypothetical protein
MSTRLVPLEVDTNADCRFPPHCGKCLGLLSREAIECRLHAVVKDLKRGDSMAGAELRCFLTGPSPVARQRIGIFGGFDFALQF